MNAKAAKKLRKQLRQQGVDPTDGFTKRHATGTLWLETGTGKYLYNRAKAKIKGVN